MKITISSDELLVILSKKFGVKVTEFQIEQSVVKTLDNFIARFPGYKIGEKIEAIKAIRQLSIDEKWFGGVIMGLGDAKDAIERWSEFREFALKNGRVPTPGHYYNTMK